MTFGIGLGAGLKALMAARLGIETAGQNVANANTLGYSRQRVMQNAAFPFTTGRGFQLGTGVDVVNIQRITDSGLERRLRSQLGQFGSSQVDFNRWGEIEGLLNEPNGGLSKDFSNFFDRLQKLQTDPSSRGLRGGVLQAGDSIASGLNHLARRFAEIEGSSFDEIRGHINTVNQLARDIGKLNEQITAMESGNSTANDLRDTREMKIKQIAELMDVRVIERNTGATDIVVAGQLMVAGTSVSQMSATRNSQGKTDVFLGNSQLSMQITRGTIGGLLRHEQSEIPGLLSRLDSIAHNLALEFNRIHSTGVPASGSYDNLRAFYGVTDANMNGTFGDELLSQSGLPFDITDGDLYVNVTNKTTGAMERTRIQIQPGSQSLQDVRNALESVANLNATIDSTGRLRVSAESGYGFDFSTKLDPNPDAFGSFGGSQPSLGSSAAGPFNLTVPSTLQININGTPTNVSFAANDFANPAAATAEEVATVINNAIGVSGEARAIGGRLVVRANSSGPVSSLSMTNVAGSPLAELRLPPSPNTTNGTTSAVEVTVFGQYTGKGNGQFVFAPDGDGDIGVTPGLTVGVFDSKGTRIATLDAGPGTKLLTEAGVEVADGVKVKMTAGTISQTDGDVFALDTLEDSDTSDVLVALGLNSMFHGNTAADLAINSDLQDAPSLFAAALSSSNGNPGNLERMLGLRDLKLQDLDSNSVEDFYGTLIGDVGFESGGAKTILEAEDTLLGALEDQRQAISGVNLDEEMINLVQFQQAFEAASRLINVMNEITTTVINLGR